MAYMFLNIYYIGVDCGGLEAPSNGSVNIRSTTYDSVANYSCNVGYALNGESLRTCLTSGEWSGTEPTCSGSFDNFKGIALFCTHCYVKQISHYSH